MVSTSFDQQKFNDFVIKHKVVGFFEKPIILKSGRPSHFYANWRTIVEDAFLTEQLTGYLIEFIQSKGLSPDTIYGVPEGATKLGVLAQAMWAKMQPNYSQGSHVLAMGRGKPKDHGDPKDRFFVGVPKGKVVIVEDVTTTGGSLIDTIKALKESNIQVAAAISLTNRNEMTSEKKSVERAVKDAGVQYYAMSNALELLPKILEREKPNKEIVSAIVKEFDEYGESKLKLIGG